MRRRLLPIVPAVAVTLGLAACGGGNEKTYVDGFNSTCKELTSAKANIQQETQAFAKSKDAKDKDAQAKFAAKVYGELIDSLATGFGKLEDLDPPKDFKDYQEKAKPVFTKNQDALKAAKKTLAPGTVAAVQAGLTSLQKLQNPPKAPDALVKKTPGCTATGLTGVDASASGGSGTPPQSGGSSQGDSGAPSGGSSSGGTSKSGSGGSSGSGSSGSGK